MTAMFSEKMETPPVVKEEALEREGAGSMHMHGGGGGLFSAGGTLVQKFGNLLVGGGRSSEDGRRQHHQHVIKRQTSLATPGMGPEPKVSLSQEKEKEGSMDEKDRDREEDVTLTQTSRTFVPTLIHMQNQTQSLHVQIQTPSPMDSKLNVEGMPLSVNMVAGGGGLELLLSPSPVMMPMLFRLASHNLFDALSSPGTAVLASNTSLNTCEAGKHHSYLHDLR